MFTGSKIIDQVAFFEFFKLPGILLDRFYAAFNEDNNNSQIDLVMFSNVMQQLFLSQNIEKLRLTFKMWVINLLTIYLGTILRTKGILSNRMLKLFSSMQISIMKRCLIWMILIKSSSKCSNSKKNCSLMSIVG